jgi:hypothetical protein
MKDSKKQEKINLKIKIYSDASIDVFGSGFSKEDLAKMLRMIADRVEDNRGTVGFMSADLG